MSAWPRVGEVRSLPADHNGPAATFTVDEVVPGARDPVRGVLVYDKTVRDREPYRCRREYTLERFVELFGETEVAEEGEPHKTVPREGGEYVERGGGRRFAVESVHEGDPIGREVRGRTSGRLGNETVTAPYSCTIASFDGRWEDAPPGG